MIMANTLLDSIGGIKTLILIALALLIAWYLRYLSKKEKEEKAVPLTPENIAGMPDKELVNAVISNLLLSCDKKNPDPYRMTAIWSNPQTNVYAVWLTVKECENGGFSKMCACADAKFLPLAADGFAQIGASDCEQILRSASENDDVETSLKEAIGREDPLALCAEYIRDNAEAF